LGGTPGYMSPEQLLGRRVDERCDIFCLGVVLFEMATGQRLYPSTDPADLVAAMSKPARRADAMDASVPRPLADLIAMALELAPERRFQSARELDEELLRMIEPVGPRAWSLALACTVWTGATLITLTLAGASTSFVYSNGLGVSGIDVVQASPVWWPYWGLRSMFRPWGVMIEVTGVR